MSLSIGIVGLPNVGKSTLFKTLTKKQVLIANYPFATIDPNVGVVLVPDERVDKLWEFSRQEARLAPNGAAKSANPSASLRARKIYATVDFIDIAGLVKGASEGEGLGNKFLANIRETDAILYVLRAFKNPDIINTQTEINPLKDKEILDVELILKDLETLDKQVGDIDRLIRTNKGWTEKQINVLKKAQTLLKEQKILIEQGWMDDEKEVLRQYQLLTMKPRLYLLNGKPEEVNLSDVGRREDFVILDVASEFESEGLSSQERVEMGMPELSGLDVLIKKSYELLGLITFLTTGEDETRAWTIKNGDTAPIAGATIHSDFQDKFVKAEVIFWEDLLKAGSYAKAREMGLIRTEGKDYIVKDGDVIEFKHG